MDAKSLLSLGRGPLNPDSRPGLALGTGSAILSHVGGTNTAPSAKTQSVLDGAVDRLSGLVRNNNLASSEAASALNKWQEAQNDKAMQFSAAEAAKNRAWQKMMSDTAHQREVKDLQAAGLNPVLSAMGGQGAAVTSGATASGVSSSGAKADVDMETSKGMVSLLSTMLANQTQLASTAMSAKTNEAIADKTNAMNQLIATLTGQYGLAREQLSGEYGLKRQGMSDSAALQRTQISSAASRYASDMQYAIHRDFPNNGWQALASVLGSIFGDDKGAGGISGAVDAVNGFTSKQVANLQNGIGSITDIAKAVAGGVVEIGKLPAKVSKQVKSVLSDWYNGKYDVDNWKK